MTTCGSFGLPASADAVDVLLDTSAAIALVQPMHTGHEQTVAAVRGRRLGLSGHAAFETFSVLTRLPQPQRLTASAAHRLIAHNFPYTRHLGARAAATLLAAFGTNGISGGSVYDALVGAAAREHGLPLVTRDTRAMQTYRALGVAVELLGTERRD